MLAASRLPFPVEWSLSGVLLKSSVLSRPRCSSSSERKSDRLALRRARGRPLPRRWPGPSRRRRRTSTRSTEGDVPDAARWSGTIRLAVYGSSEDEALRRARDLVDHYGEQLRMPLGKTLDQAQVLREFIPGEPRTGAAGNAGFRPLPGRGSAERRQRVGHADRTVLRLRHRLGAASGRFDLHHGPEKLNTPGLVADHRRTRRGKERADRTLAYNAVRCGERTIIFDPSGPLAAAVPAPELAPFAASWT